mmetsp:Transcript_23197/g.37077  ORF Transcript_23197/g.37077 Transcript_23197/m.37077 type:complete len:295 (+) Transcript_23197:33-917(+)
MEILVPPDDVRADTRGAWPDTFDKQAVWRSLLKRTGTGNVGRRSVSCGMLPGACGKSQKRRPPSRKPCADRLSWELCGLLEVDVPGDLLVSDSRQAKCHVCHAWFPKKPLFGKQSGRYVRRDPLFFQFWVCTACVANPHGTLPSMGDTSFSEGKPASAAEVSGLRRCHSTPCGEVLDDEVASLPSPGGSQCLARLGAAVVNDVTAEGRRSRPSTPAHNSWVTMSCQACAKALSTNVETRGATAEPRLCNACQADRELSGASSRRLPAETLRPAWSVHSGRWSNAWELVDLSASK